MIKSLGKLNKVDLRDVWKHEALDFTNWLSSPENLELLSDEIGVEISPIQTEAEVGNFRVDILAEEEGTGRKIIIENQMESTDHDHLGKIITYASGYNAEVIIWIVRDVREEHQRAIDWLNEHTDERIGFFLVKIELWQIEESKPAPKFVIVESPNEWAKITKTGLTEMNETKRKQLEFWTNFKAFVLERGPKMSMRTPSARSSYDMSIGSSDAHIHLALSSTKNLVSCNFYIEDNNALYDFLFSRKEDIETALGEHADWNQAKKASVIKIKKQVSDVFSQNDAQNCFEWLYEKMFLFKQVFVKYLQEFKNVVPE